MKPKYTLNDLTIRPVNRQTADNGITKHSHEVLFERALTAEEQQEFIRLILSVCQKIDSYQSLANEFFCEPSVTFIAPNQASYTLTQRSMAGDWKDLVFANLATFSQEVVGILQHDDNPAFAPPIMPKISRNPVS